MRTKMTVGRMAVKTTNPGKPVKKTAEQAQAEALSRYNAKKASQKALSSSMAKTQAAAAERYNAKKEAKSGEYKTNPKGQLVLAGGRTATYKGGVTPEKMKSANVRITKTLPEVSVKATKRAAVSNLASYKNKAKK